MLSVLTNVSGATLETLFALMCHPVRAVKIILDEVLKSEQVVTLELLKSI